MIGASTILGMELTAVMKGWKMALRRSERPSVSPTTKPLDTPVRKPKKVFLSVIAVVIHRLFSLRAMHLAKSPLNQPLTAPSLDLKQLRMRKCWNISEGFDTK